MLVALIIAIVVLGGSVGCSNSNSELAESISRLAEEIEFAEWQPPTADEYNGLTGSARSIIIERIDGTIVRMDAGKGAYSEYEAFYIFVQSDHIVVHLSKPGEARNAADARELIPFSAVASIKRLADDSDL